MKRYALYLAALALAASTQAAAQGTTSTHSSISENRLVKAEKNYLACLSSENPGLVESAIAQVARFQILYPGQDLNATREKLGELSISGRTACTRYKAHLAAAVLDNPALMATAHQIAGMSNDELFTTIADRLQTTLLGYSVQ